MNNDIDMGDPIVIATREFYVKNDSELKIRVDLGIDGNDSFYINDALVKKRKGMGKGTSYGLELDVNNHKIKFSISVSKDNSYSKVYLDGELYIDCLFPELEKYANKRLLEHESGSSTFKMAIIAIIVLALVYMTIRQIV